MSRYRRLATAGISLACAGIFLGAPAQAATGHHTPSAAATAHTATSTTARAANGSAESGYKSFSSSAKSAGHTTVRSRSVLPYGAQAASVSTIYVLADTVACTKELGAGTDADPYCLLQSAVNAAVAGDTIEVWQNYDAKFEYTESVDISGKSDLTILGEGTGVGDAAPQGDYGVNITNSTGITIQNLALYADSAVTVTVTQSSDITFDQDSLISMGGLNTLAIGSGASNVAVTRSTIADFGGIAAAHITSGSKNVTLASDVVYSVESTPIEADSANGLDIVGDTIERDCYAAVNITASSTSVSIENNVLEAGTVAAACPNLYGPDVTVDSTSTAGTTVDYNDFVFEAMDSTAAYAWGGTSYATLAAFQAAVSQGTHDAVDPTRDVELFLTPDGMNVTGNTMEAEAAPTAKSLSIGTANTSAPGYLSTDFYGRANYDDRGAIAYVAPALTAALTAYQNGALSVYAVGDASVERDAVGTFSYNWGDGTTTNYSTGDTSHTYPHPGTYTISVTVTDIFDDTSSTTVSVQTAGSDYTPVGPVRVLDTRKGTGTNGVIASVGSKQTLTLKIAGVGAVPSTATAATLNLTVTDTKGYGFIAAYPAGSSAPTTSNVNFSTGQTVANMSIVPIGTGGDIELYNGGTGSVDLVADEAGYFTAAQADGFKSLTPVRLLDTRTTTGGHNAPLTASDPVRLKVAGVGGVPADVKAVAVNLTVASPTMAGYIRAFPDSGSVPGVSNVNFNANQVIANAAIVPVGSDGYIDVKLTGSGSLRMIVDVNGYFSANASEAISAYEPYTPYRYLDTRTIKNGTLPAGYYYHLLLGSDFWGNVLPTVTGVVTNTTVTQTTTGGDLSVFPDKHDSSGNLVIPRTSTLNFAKGATVPNLAISAPGSDGEVDFLNQSAGSLQLIVDVYGYFQSA